jgi:hypothetical protein
MNPNRGEASQANFELPQPASPEAADDSLDGAVEAPTAAPETVGKRSSQPALPTVPDDVPVADQPAIPAAQAQADDHAAATTQAVIPDSEHIERSWIDKTRAVISQAREDPYIQKNEVSKIKAEYIQKRFNKEIKTEESAK